MNRLKTTNAVTTPAWLVGVALLTFLLAFASAPAASKSRHSKQEKLLLETTDLDADLDGSGSSKIRKVALSFKQMGAWSAVKLRGVNGARALGFPIRADEVVVGAKLRIAYDYSPALIPELSHLKVLLNEHTAAVLGLAKDKSIGNTADISLNPRWFRDDNELRFEFIGHYTRQCEDPFHSSLWLTLSDLGRLELTLASVPSQGDLKKLPAPFFDKRDIGTLSLPFVFADKPSLGVLQAAGSVASWFGSQAGTRGAQFPTWLNALPAGNAVVFLLNGDSVEGVKGESVASVSVRPHPRNPAAKLLLVTGGAEKDLMAAAQAIALSATSLSGPRVRVNQGVEAAARKPYDAPAWIPTDRKVHFGELLRPEELQVRGNFPEVIRLNYRVPPDVFTWRTDGVPVQLQYRATRLPGQKNSSLNVSLNSYFIRALALNEPGPETAAQDAAATVRQEALWIPPHNVGGRDQLQFAYYFDISKEGDCQNVPPNNLQAAVDPESSIDFSDFPHYAALPNLAYFSSMGFPFTRMADLSETAVVLPDHPNANELTLYLTVMGRMAESTGYPALRHALVRAAEVDQVARRDLVVIGSAKNQALMSQWADALPMVQINGERRLREPDATWWPSYRWEQTDVHDVTRPKGAVHLSEDGSLAAIMAFESPLKSARSVVFFYADKPADLRKITDVLSDPERQGLIQGDFVVVDDKRLHTAKVGATYYIGSLPLWSKVRWFFADHPLTLAFLVLLACAVLAALGWRLARRMRWTKI